MRRPVVIAHRGDWLEGPGDLAQNSVAAVLRGLRAGADGAEVDARLTGDGEIVLHHDALLGPGDVAAGCAFPAGTPIRACTRAELAHLATLEELVLSMASGHPGQAPVLNVELKDLPGEPGWDADYPLARKVAQVLKEKGVVRWPGSAGSLACEGVMVVVIVSSFDPNALRALSVEVPSLATGLLVEAGESWQAIPRTLPGLSALHPAEVDADLSLFEAAGLTGLHVIPWTVDDPGRARELAALGAAAVITNRPRALLSALG